MKDSTPLEAIVEGVEESHSPSPEDDERNREYLIRRAALCDNPTEDEMRAVVAYGLEQHRINFPELYIAFPTTKAVYEGYVERNHAFLASKASKFLVNILRTIQFEFPHPSIDQEDHLPIPNTKAWRF